MDDDMYNFFLKELEKGAFDKAVVEKREDTPGIIFVSIFSKKKPKIHIFLNKEKEIIQFSFKKDNLYLPVFVQVSEIDNKNEKIKYENLLKVFIEHFNLRLRLLLV